jgi:hypothetical protein
LPRCGTGDTHGVPPHAERDPWQDVLACMSGDFFTSSEHAGSGRAAFVAGEGDSVWLYLTEAVGTQIVADCWLFNLIPAPTEAELEPRKPAYRAKSQPPPATAEVTTADAFRVAPLGDGDVQFAWSADGESVAAWVGDRLAGFIARAERRGYSVHLVAECPWGRPADPALYKQLFDTTADV